MGWVEDAIMFRGAIRRSGNSLVITIPAELSQRFLLREGQEIIIYGLSRRGPEFEGALQIYLGYFVAHEKAPAITFKIRAPVGRLGQLQEILKEVEAKHLPSSLNTKKLEENIIELELIFGSITPNALKRIRSMDEVNSAAAEIEFKLSSSGFDVVEKTVTEKIIEWRNIDPAILSKAPLKVSEVVRWRWEI